MSCQVKLYSGLLLLLFLLTGELSAVPVEFGLAHAPGFRSPNSLDRGLDKFRSGLDPERPTVVQHDRFRNTLNYEFWIRFGDLPMNGSYVGLTLGEYPFPSVGLREAGPEPGLLDFELTLRLSYFLLTYHRQGALTGHWRWEFGAGLGFLDSVRLKTSGYYSLPSGVSRYSSSHLAHFGNIWRLELGLYRPLGDRLILRGGLRVSYLYFGDFSGTLNGLPSDWYFAADGGLTQLTSLDLLNATVAYRDPIYGATQLALIRERASISLGLREIYLALGVRF